MDVFVGIILRGGSVGSVYDVSTEGCGEGCGGGYSRGGNAGGYGSGEGDGCGCGGYLYAYGKMVSTGRGCGYAAGGGDSWGNGGLSNGEYIMMCDEGDGYGGSCRIPGEFEGFLKWTS